MIPRPFSSLDNFGIKFHKTKIFGIDFFSFFKRPKNTPWNKTLVVSPVTQRLVHKRKTKGSDVKTSRIFNIKYYTLGGFYLQNYDLPPWTITWSHGWLMMPYLIFLKGSDDNGQIGIKHKLRKCKN